MLYYHEMITKISYWVIGGIGLTVFFGFYWVNLPDKITIKPNRTLIWKDFKHVDMISGRESINATCISTTDFEIRKIHDEGDHKRITLNAVIEQQKELSQVSRRFLNRANKSTRDQVLHHENGHFKIAQIIGHRIVREVEAFLFDPHEFKTQLDSIVRSHYRDWSQLDRHYDHETTAPRDPEKQREWDIFFKNELMGN